MLPQNKFDLIIVGGGPAGTTAAKYAASQGIDVLVLEKDKEIGVPVVLPSNTPDNISALSDSFLCVVNFDCPGLLLSISF